MARHLDVWLHESFVGQLTQTDAGRLAFEYDGAWLASPSPVPLSLSLPLTGAPYGHRESEPFFGGLLPEEGVRERVARYLGVSANNDFALLEEIGGECAGAVALVPRGTPVPARDDTEAAPLTPLDDERLAQLLDDLPKRPLLAGGERRLSLAGAQDKIAVSLADGRIAIPADASPTTHILKVPIQGFEGTVANELLCMRTASALGLRTASVERRVASGREFLLVERFDREIDARGRVTRVHQEDFCQALGVPTRMKYQSEGGPSLADCFGLLTQHARRPAVDRLAMMRATLFNVLVGNADAHAKNFSLTRGAELVLAPLYDLLSTLAYEDLSPRYAMRIDSKGQFKDIRSRHWDAFAAAAGLAPALLRRELKSMAERLPSVLGETLETLDEHCRSLPVMARVIDETRTRCELTLIRISER